MKFMVDLHIYGMNWIEVSRENCDSFTFKDSFIFLNTKCANLKSYAPIDEWSIMAPLKILSFDIECISKKSQFPKAEFDPVIAISCVLKVFGDDTVCDKQIFCLKGCESIPGATISSFESEYFLLKGFHEYFIRANPDIIIGYNILNFDFPYLITRALVLGLPEFTYLGRLSGRFKYLISRCSLQN
jgi:DNA polymerase delta subunit 1